MEALRPNPVRSLFAGLLCFSVLMLFVAWAGIGELFIPPNTTGPGIRFIDMPAPLLALNVAICALPIAALVLILAGLAGMMEYVQGVGPRLVWRFRDHDVTAVRVAALLLLSYAALFVLLVVLGYFSFVGSPLDPVIGLAGGLAFSAVPITLGWYLMLVSAWALAPQALPWERTALRAAVVEAGVASAALIAANVGATLALGTAALQADVEIPSRVPWADAICGTAGFAAVLVLTLVARRASKRYRTPWPAAAPQPA